MPSIAELKTENGIRRGREDEFELVNTQLREIFAVAKHEGWDAGEVQSIAGAQFGARLAEIDNSRYPEIKEWFRHNGHRRLQIVDPYLHECVMESADPALADYQIKFR